MAVIDKSENKEEITKAKAAQDTDEAQFLKELTQGADKVVNKDDEEKKEDDLTETEDGEEAGTDDAEEAGEEEAGEETEEGADEEGEEAANEEKTPAQKRIDELIAEQKRLRAENERLKNRKAEPDETDDPDLKRLEKMSLDQLKSLKKEVRLSLRTENDEAKARRLVELEDKIDDTIQTAPQRFEQQQLRQYNEAVKETLQEMGKDFTPATQQKIFAKAKSIFERFPTLQQAQDGQAVAWQQAVDWYREISKLSSKAEKTDEVARENNKLKKKVNLETTVQRGAKQESENQRNFRKAKQGDKRAELNFIKEELGL